MAPNITSVPTGVLFEDEKVEDLHTSMSQHPSKEQQLKDKEYKLQIVWRNVIIFVFLHIGALYGVYLAVTSAKIATTVFGEFIILREHVCAHVCDM